ncbi:MAG: twin-arginine translocation signal domain-containing protein, partial [Verrucomicrobiae bacterium]|nr:twin-arginine translocation signal domain-containing protein [Verrucomicrobiae bacterium]
MNRRDFLAKGAAAAAGLSALAAAMSPLRHLNPDDLPSAEEFLQKHYKEMTPEDKQAVLARVKREVDQRFKTDATVTDPQPLDGVEY